MNRKICLQLGAKVFRQLVSRSARRGLPCVMTGALVGVLLSQVGYTNGPHIYAIKDAHIVTVTNGTLAKGTVVVRDGLIEAVGERVKVPEDARVIDGSGLTVYPGLIDAHTDLALKQPQPA